MGWKMYMIYSGDEHDGRLMNMEVVPGMVVVGEVFWVLACIGEPNSIVHPLMCSSPVSHLWVESFLEISFEGSNSILMQ